MSSAGQEAIELAASAGLHLDPWEAEGLDDALGERPDGRWAASSVGLIVPRQNGKGAILTARELAGLFLFDEQLLVHTAHEFKTSQEAFLRILPLIDGTPDLRRRVRKMRTAHGEEGIELRNGARLRFLARSTASGRGFSGDVVFLDEAYQLSALTMSALIPIMGTIPNSQLWYTSSAPLKDEASKVLRRLCRRGRAGLSNLLAYIEYCGDNDRYLNEEGYLDDPQAWADANPGYPFRLLPENVEKEREELEAEDFARERLGIWFDDEEVGEQVLPPEDWAACHDADSTPTEPFSFALDVAPDRGSAAFAVAATSERGGAHLEVIDHRSGTRWVVERAKQLHKAFHCPIGVAQNSPAWSLQPELVAAGVEVTALTVSEHVQACGKLYDTVTERGLRHLGQPHLNKAVNGADSRPYGDAWVWSRRNSLVDISPLVASTLALWLHSQPAPPAAWAPATAEASDIFRPKERLEL